MQEIIRVCHVALSVLLREIFYLLHVVVSEPPQTQSVTQSVNERIKLHGWRLDNSIESYTFCVDKFSDRPRKSVSLFHTYLISPSIMDSYSKDFLECLNDFTV